MNFRSVNYHCYKTLKFSSECNESEENEESETSEIVVEFKSDFKNSYAIIIWTMIFRLVASIGRHFKVVVNALSVLLTLLWFILIVVNTCK